jgi:SNF2 family DNA or RNA helicase
LTFPGILADEMGLGKTVQTISFLAHLEEVVQPQAGPERIGALTARAPGRQAEELRGPHLIVCPASVVRPAAPRG